MDTDIYLIHARSVAQVQNSLGSKCPVFTWPSDSDSADDVYRILPGSATRRKDLGSGGFRMTSDLRFIVLVEELPEPGPELQQTIAYRGDTYRIDSIETLPGGLMKRFECNDPDPA